jgi:hypothetical protein
MINYSEFLRNNGSPKKQVTVVQYMFLRKHIPHKYDFQGLGTILPLEG